MHFSESNEPSPSSNSYSRQPDSITTESGKAELVIPPVDKSVKPLEFVFIIDESFSNANNGQNIILGLQNFVSQLPDTALSVKVYLIGKDNYDILGENGSSEIQLSSTRRKTTYLSKIKPAFFEVTKSSSTSTSEFKATLKAEFAKVSTYLSTITGGGPDTFPKVQEIAALMNERQGQGTKSRTIYIYATDEDVPSNYTGTRFKSWITESIAVPVIMTGMYVFLTQTKQNLEGGGFTLIPGQLKGCPTCYPKVDSCSDIAGIKQAILDNPNHIEASNTYSECSFQPGGQITGWQSDPKASQFVSFSGKPFISNLSNIETQIQDLNNQPDQPQYFIGLFSILEPSEIKNTDQKVSTNIQ